MLIHLKGEIERNKILGDFNTHFPSGIDSPHKKINKENSGIELHYRANGPKRYN